MFNISPISRWLPTRTTSDTLASAKSLCDDQRARYVRYNSAHLQTFFTNYLSQRLSRPPPAGRFWAETERAFAARYQYNRGAGDVLIPRDFVLEVTGEVLLDVDDGVTARRTPWRHGGRPRGPPPGCRPDEHVQAQGLEAHNGVGRRRITAILSIDITQPFTYDLGVYAGKAAGEDHPRGRYLALYEGEVFRDRLRAEGDHLRPGEIGAHGVCRTSSLEGGSCFRPSWPCTPRAAAFSRQVALKTAARASPFSAAEATVSISALPPGAMAWSMNARSLPMRSRCAPRRRRLAPVYERADIAREEGAAGFAGERALRSAKQRRSKLKVRELRVARAGRGRPAPRRRPAAMSSGRELRPPSPSTHSRSFSRRDAGRSPRGCASRPFPWPSP